MPTNHYCGYTAKHLLLVLASNLPGVKLITCFLLTSAPSHLPFTHDLFSCVPNCALQLLEKECGKPAEWPPNPHPHCSRMARSLWKHCSMGVGWRSSDLCSAAGPILPSVLQPREVRRHQCSWVSNWNCNPSRDALTDFHMILLCFLFYEELCASLPCVGYLRDCIFNSYATLCLFYSPISLHARAFIMIYLISSRNEVSGV